MSNANNVTTFFNSNTKFSCVIKVDESKFQKDLNTEFDRIRQR